MVGIYDVEEVDQQQSTTNRSLRWFCVRAHQKKVPKKFSQKSPPPQKNSLTPPAVEVLMLITYHLSQLCILVG